MSTSIEAKLFAAASADPTLQGLLGSNPFRWFNTQLAKGTEQPFFPPPLSVTIMVISDVPLYANVVRNMNSKARVQFTLWEGPQPDTSDTLLNAIRNFLDNLCFTSGTTFTQIINVRRGYIAQTQTGVFQKIVDAYIWNDDTT